MNCVPLPGRFLGIETMLQNARGNIHFTLCDSHGLDSELDQSWTAGQGLLRKKLAHCIYEKLT